ncbi:MAG: hypothetical protein WCC87_00210 [Candidatus Korobacteraceae bacterium]
MSRILIFLFVLLGSALWLQAQEGSPGADIWLAPSGPHIVEGCLQSSGTHYMVTTKDGTVTRLAGNTARLSRYVGHEVEITGKPTIISLDTTEKDDASTVEELPALEVKSAKEISQKCDVAASSPG